ncbi:MAG: hypothetical protein EA380_02735 [Phycisphaeraceae bacterium]|nr:MAG: hypothetical protein EA380_02735 [Phycisphaeraceae bacterium]
MTNASTHTLPADTQPKMPKPRADQPAHPQQQQLTPAQRSGPIARLIGALLVIASIILKPLALIGAAVATLASFALIAITLVSANWVILVLQLGACVAALLAIPSALGRFREGPALALASTGSVLGACAVLTEPAFVTTILAAGASFIEITAFGRTIPIIWLAAPQAIAGGLLVASGAFVVWSRHPARSGGYLFTSAWTGAAALAMIAGAVFLSRPGFINTVHRHLGQWAGQALIAMAVILGFFVLVGFVAACGHCLIRSLEVGTINDDRSPAPSK